MQRSIKTIIFIALLMLPANTHHDVGLCVGVPVNLGDDQALRQDGSLGRIDGVGNRAVQIGQSLVDVLAQR